MKTLWTLVLLLAIGCRDASANESKLPSGLPAGTRMVCDSEQSIGFRWVKGNWKSTDFVPARYSVTKAGDEGKRSPICGTLPGSARMDDKTGLAVLYGCYTVRREVSDQDGGTEHVCRERWQKAGDTWMIVDIACENFRFRPDGWFHRTSLHGDLADKPDGDEKEPLSITVGHCRTL